MFEEICRKTGTIKIPTGEYSDSVPVEAKFIDEAGNEYDLTAAKYIFNHFDNTFEFNKLTVAKHG